MSDGSRPRAVVTGACSGIGLDIARTLAARGWDLCICSENAERLSVAANELRAKHGALVDEAALDLSEPSNAKVLHEFASEGRRRVDALVCNAGFFFFGEVADADPARAQAMLQLHVVVPSLLCAYFARDFRELRAGRIMVTSSISAFRDFPGIAHYASSKKYLRAFAASLRCELAVYDVSVTCLLPGATATGLYDRDVVPVELATKLGVMMPSERVAREGVDAMLAGDAECVPGVFNRAVTSSIGLVPQGAIDALRKWGPWLKHERSR